MTIHAQTAPTLTGQRAGLLTVLRYAGSKGGKGALWECRCHCGRIIVTTGTQLRRAQRDDPLFGCPDCRATAKAKAFRSALGALCKEHGYPIDWVETTKVILIRIHKPAQEGASAERDSTGAPTCSAVTAGAGA